MQFPIDCPNCGEEVDGVNAEKIDKEPSVTVARRQQAFDGSITSLREMNHFGYMVRLPCGCEIYTVN